MAQINQLSAYDSPSAGDQLPIFSTGNGDARKISLSAFAAWLANAAMSALTVGSYVKVEAVTVANLPSAVTAGAGARAMVSNASATTFNSIVAGGGANIVPVFSDGTNWRIG